MNADTVITVCSILFAYSMIPQVFKSLKEKKVEINYQTIILTIIGMFGTLPVYISNQWTFATITTAASLLCWTILLTTKIIYRPRFAI